MIYIGILICVNTLTYRVIRLLLPKITFRFEK